MKKNRILIIETCLILFLLIFPGLSIKGQDIIVKRNGEEIKSKVEQVLDTEIKYRKAENPAGPVYSVKKAEVFMIKYEKIYLEISLLPLLRRKHLQVRSLLPIMISSLQGMQQLSAVPL
jgi:hypothetical protein